MIRARKVHIGIGVFITLAIVGSCIGNDERPSSKHAAETIIVNPRNEPVVVGTVTEVNSPRVTVEADNSLGVKITVSLAHVGYGTCYDLRSALGKQLVEALPVGSKVTVVRMPRDVGSTKIGDTAFIHSGANGTNDPSVNEQIVAMGNGMFDPQLDHGWNAAPVEAQLPALMSQVPAAAEPYVDALIAADVAAWDQSLGGVGVCRAEYEENQHYVMERYGADGLAGTADDPVDVNVDMPNVDLPNVNFPDLCRKWWC